MGEYLLNLYAFIYKMKFNCSIFRYWTLRGSENSTGNSLKEGDMVEAGMGVGDENLKPVEV